MTIYEAASFYGDYRMLLAEIAEELSTEKVENTTIAATFFEVNGSTQENLILKSQSV